MCTSDEKKSACLRRRCASGTSQSLNSLKPIVKVVILSVYISENYISLEEVEFLLLIQVIPILKLFSILLCSSEISLKKTCFVHFQLFSSILSKLWEVHQNQQQTKMT